MSKVILLQPTYSSSGWLEPTPAAQGTKRDPTLDRTPFYQRATLTHTHTQTGTVWICQLTHTSVGAPRENPHRHGEKVQTSQGQWPGRGSLCSFSFFFH